MKFADYSHGTNEYLNCVDTKHVIAFTFAYLCIHTYTSHVARLSLRRPDVRYRCIKHIIYMYIIIIHIGGGGFKVHGKIVEKKMEKEENGERRNQMHCFCVLVWDVTICASLYESVYSSV